MQKRHGLKIASGLVMGSSMMLMTLLPAASAMAATMPMVTSVKLSAEQGTVAVGNTVSFTATATQSGSGTPMYNFWYQGVNGNWHSNGWSSSNSFSLPALQSGSYEVVVYSADKGQTTPANSEGTMSNQFVNVNSTLKVSTNASSVAPLSPVTITAQSTNLTNAVYQYWLGTPNGNGGYNWAALNVNGSNGDYSSATSATFTPANAGTYQIAVYAKDLNAPQDAQFSKSVGLNEAVFGAASAVKLSAASSSLVADGQATDTITATVVDSNGNTVANYNGTVNVAITNNGAAHLVGANTTDYANGVTSLSAVPVTNGVATFQVVGSMTSGLSDTISLNGLTGGNNGTNLNYGTVSVSTVPATATQLALTSALPSFSVNTSTDAQTSVSVQVEDAAGNAFDASQYVTLTLTGPGSFSPTSAMTTETVYAAGGVISNLPVYGDVGNPGTINITATSTGLTSANLAIPTYVNTAPTSLSLKGSTQSIGGVNYTEYTVQLLDSNGHPITQGTAAGTGITLSDNTSTVGGTLNYYSNNSGQPGTALTSMNQALSSGQYVFWVANSTVGTSNPTITVTDPTENFTSTAPYTYQVGSPAQVAFSSTSAGYVKAGESVTFTAQLEDAMGNPLTTAGQNVVFYFGSNNAGATLPNGVSLTGSATANDYVATTNSQGMATVTVQVPSGATQGNGFTVDGNLQNGTMNAAVGPSETVESGASLATSMAFGSLSGTTFTPDTWPTNNTMTVGVNNMIATGQNVQLENAINGVATSADQLSVTTSNPNVLALGSYNANSTTTDTVTANSGTGVAILPSITGKLAGTATITVTDLSNPNVPSISETLTVNPGVYSTGMIYVSGAPVSQTSAGSNDLTVSANAPVAITVMNTDAEGNPVPVTTTETHGAASESFALTDPNGGQFRATANGADIQNVSIPVGQESTTVYYVNGTAGSYYGLTATAPMSASAATMALGASASATPVAGVAQSYTIALTGSTFSGTLPITVTGALNSPNGTAPVLPTSATFVNGTATVSATLYDAVAQTLAVSVEGLTSGTLTVTPTASTVAPTANTATATVAGATVSWTAPATAPAGGYQVWEIPMVNGVANTASATDISNPASTATSYDVTGLTAGSSYEFNVDSVDAYGNVVHGTPSSPIEYTASGVPSSVTVGSVSTSTTASPYTYSWTVTVKDSAGNGVQGLTYNDFTVADSTASVSYTGSGTLATGDFTVVPTSTPGVYTVKAESSSAVTATDTVTITAAANGTTASGSGTF